MRDYATIPNLLRAALLSVAVTVLSVPRFVATGFPLVVGTAAMLISMTLVAAAVTAWGRCAGMAGVLPDGRTVRQGVVAAVLLGLLCWPVCRYALDPALQDALLDASARNVVQRLYPRDIGGRVALVLWTAGFQVLFLQAAPMSLAARLTGSRAMALVCCVVLRVYVTRRYVSEESLQGLLGLMLAPGLLGTLGGCLLFAYYGLVPAAVFAAVVTLRLLLPGSAC